MRARVHQSRGSRRYRALSFLPALLLLCTAMVLPSVHVFLLALSLAALTPLLFSALMRLAPKSAEIELGAGQITIRRRGLPGQTIAGKTLVGASTAQLGERVALSLDTGREPITLELESEADADAVRQTLGAGHYGFGHVQWFSKPDLNRLFSLTGIAVSAASFAFLKQAGDVQPGGNALQMLLGVLAVVLSVAGPAVALMSVALLPPRLVLRPEGVAIFRVSAASTVPPTTFHAWPQIHHAEERRGRLVIVLTTGAQLHVDRRSWWIDWRGMTRAQRSHIVAQINSAARRARGRGKPRPTVAEELEQLAESTLDTRTWLARVEAAAERMRADVGYYRGSSIAGEDLWSALENHDAPARVRATAARLLARVETDAAARERIQRAVGSVREERTQQRIRIAIGEDLEQTAQETEAIDAAENERDRSAAAARLVYRG